ncbi:MAG: hypothetical protein KJ666_09105 [Bacteroidetes bacterium]|nr:hypothetical protein [Bacteroidota bacterium]MBU2584913.1 hypothetical protein [Bacteroidota bacterium]
MKKEYDFSKGVRGKFYHLKVNLNLPIYLDKDVAEFVQLVAKRKKIDPQTAANRIIRSTKQAVQVIE